MEIDLYKDLTAFTELTPEQKKKEIERGGVRPAVRVHAPAPDLIQAEELRAERPGSVVIRAEDLMDDDDDSVEGVEAAGGKVGGETPTIARCPACGNQFTGEDLFCASCGAYQDTASS
jgi:hypothetical protein